MYGAIPYSQSSATVLSTMERIRAATVLFRSSVREVRLGSSRPLKKHILCGLL